MKNTTTLVLLTVVLITKPSLADNSASKAPFVKDGIQPAIWVVSADWASHIPPAGSVNVPERIDALCPGQRIALAVAATGPVRESVFEGRTLDVHLESAGTKTENRGLKPLAIRRIKAEGADMALGVLEAAGIGEKDKSKLELAMSVVTFAVFQPDWIVPDVDHAAEVNIRAAISNEASQRIMLQPVSIKIRPWTDWAKEPEADMEAINAHLRGYHDNLSPGLLLPYLEGAARHGALQSPAACEFFATEFKRNPAARSAALQLLPSLDSSSQRALLLVLRLGGEDVSGVLHLLPSAAQASIRTIAPLRDARELPIIQDPVSVDAVRNIGSSMDRCWGAWMATGDPAYLRALVNVLDGADDFPKFIEWEKAKGGVKGLNARVARGLAYQIAGWSLGSFERTDPHVSDWLIFWENYPELPFKIRNQIVSLPTNPAFRR